MDISIVGGTTLTNYWQETLQMLVCVAGLAVVAVAVLAWKYLSWREASARVEAARLQLQIEQRRQLAAAANWPALPPAPAPTDSRYFLPSGSDPQGW